MSGLTFRSYGPDELLELAERGTGEARISVCGERSGIALPDWVVPCVVVSAEKARRLAAQLLIACDEHDAIQESAFQIPPVVESQPECDEQRHADTEASLRDALIEARACLADGFPLAAGRVLLTAVAAFVGETS